MTRMIFYMISVRDVDAITECIVCDWWHPQGYKKNNYLGKKWSVKERREKKKD